MLAFLDFRASIAAPCKIFPKGMFQCLYYTVKMPICSSNTPLHGNVIIDDTSRSIDQGNNFKEILISYLTNFHCDKVSTILELAATGSGKMYEQGPDELSGSNGRR